MTERGEIMKRHLFLIVKENGKTLNKLPIEDPFHTTQVDVDHSFSFWERVKILFGSPFRAEILVKVQADDVPIRWWFGSGDERKSIEQLDAEQTERMSRPRETMLGDECNCAAQSETKR